MTDRQLYLIDQYHQNKLSSEERQEFDEEMTKPTFTELVEFGSEVQLATRLADANTFRNKVQGWEHEINTKKTKSLFYVKYVIGVAAIVVLALALWTYRSCSRQTVNESQQLYAEYIQPYKNIYLPVVRSEEEMSVVTRAMSAYESKNFEDAIRHFEQIPTSALVTGDRFYCGLSYLMVGNDMNAKAFLNAAKVDEKYNIPARWYLFLLAIKEGNRAEWNRLGEELMHQHSHPYIADKSKELMRQLN